MILNACCETGKQANQEQIEGFVSSTEDPAKNWNSGCLDLFSEEFLTLGKLFF